MTMANPGAFWHLTAQGDISKNHPLRFYHKAGERYVPVPHPLSHDVYSSNDNFVLINVLCTNNRSKIHTYLNSLRCLCMYPD